MVSFVAKWKAKYPKLKVWSEKAENVLTFYEFPEGLRRLIYTNNRIESFNKQIDHKEALSDKPLLEPKFSEMFLSTLTDRDPCFSDIPRIESFKGTGAQRTCLLRNNLDADCYSFWQKQI